MLRKLIRWLLALLGLGDDDPPAGLTTLTAEVDAMNVRLNWTLSTPGEKQRPLDHVRIEKRADGIEEWTPINEVGVDTTELLDQDVPPGTWHYRGVEVDVDGRAASRRPEATVEVPFDEPSGLVELTAELE